MRVRHQDVIPSEVEGPAVQPLRQVHGIPRLSLRMTCLGFTQRVRLQLFQRDKLQRRGMRRFQIYRCRNAAFKRIFPTRHTHAPFIARLQPGKIPFRMRRHEIVAIEDGKIEKLPCQLRANGVLSHVVGPSMAKSIAKKSGERIAATRFQFGSENIRWHEPTCRHPERSRGMPGKLP